MGVFEQRYKQLNNQQRIAVDTIDGPLLVIAGPGTGKTELLSMRVANILKQPDVSPSNILCITFTDNAARNMRERLQQIIGQAAYHVQIHTFHSFGTDVINQYPDFFASQSLLQPIDELGSYEILRDIFQSLPHTNPLAVKVGEEFIYLRDTLRTISWVKQNALLPEELNTILTHNANFFATVGQDLADCFRDSPSTKYLDRYKSLLKTFLKHSTHHEFAFPGIATMAANELSQAIEDTPTSGRYATSITSWRNRWCQKDSKGNFEFKDAGRSLQKMHALVDIYAKYRTEQKRRGLFDFDDMIVEVVHALEHNNELKFNLQERYQYILIDEFQDTNKAQMRIIHSLGDNPVNESRPNIMAVGDDDQAIYAFQGAESSNMVDFISAYRDVAMITLTENYRSSQEILEASRSVILQADNRLEDLVKGINKSLNAQIKIDDKSIDYTVLESELSQYQWIAENVKHNLKNGIEPQNIAILAPKHKYLERLIPYLANQQLPIAYERRENILDAPIIHQIISMSQLTDALSRNDQHTVDALFAEILTYEFWGIPLESIAQLSITCYKKGSHWLECLFESDEKLASIARWFLEGARQNHTQPLEYMLDRIIGPGDKLFDDNEYTEPVPAIENQESFISPLRMFYFSDESFNQNTDTYLSLLGKLSTLRHKLRSWQPDRMLTNKDFVEFVRLHRDAKLKIIDTNPHTQTTNAVQVMTVYKSKGLEFDVVYAINAQDEIWGPSARTKSDLIRTPLNLPIKPAGQSVDDKLRLLYVALTRCKRKLNITSYNQTLDNKLSPHLSFLQPEPVETNHKHFKQRYISFAAREKAEQILATDWQYKFKDIIADKPTLLEPILQNYKLSVTHLNTFLDVVNAGPIHFLNHNLLRFPQAMTPHAAYGDAIHKTLQWIYTTIKGHPMPSPQKINAYFVDMLSRKHLDENDYQFFRARGKESLAIYIKQRQSSFSPKAIIERGFHNEGVVIGEAHLSGAIDKIEEINPVSFRVIDFKTGQPSVSWYGKHDYEKHKLHKYRQQLLFYKLLIEHSSSFGGKYSATQGQLEFVEPDNDGHIVDPLVLTYSDKEIDRFVRLLQGVWRHIQALSFPDVSHYSKDYNGVIAFEEDIINGRVAV